MDKKSKILLWIFVGLIAISVAVTYWRIMIKRDYVIEAQVDCDPYAEACFVWECDPTSTVEGEACVGDPESDVWYFKVAKRNAGRIPLCDPNTDEDCQPMLCAEDEMECEEMLCTEDQLEAQYASYCVDPVVFAAENPAEEEEETAAECAEGDVECEAGLTDENINLISGDDDELIESVEEMTDKADVSTENDIPVPEIKRDISIE